MRATSVPTAWLSVYDTRRCGHVGCNGPKVRNCLSLGIGRCCKVFKTTYPEPNMWKSCTMTITNRISSRRYNSRMRYLSTYVKYYSLRRRLESWGSPKGGFLYLCDGSDTYRGGVPQPCVETFHNATTCDPDLCEEEKKLIYTWFVRILE